ncbi:MAG: DnaJ C-terminal domain-containing protein [Rhodomicrobiaceae bacterium]
MADPYTVLGVPRDASQDDIRKAYRRLAKKNHPDLNPGNEEAEKRFKEVSAAYGIIGNEEKRARFDRGEIDESGAERPPERQYYRQSAEAEPGFKYYSWSSEGGGEDMGDIFSDLFRNAGRGGAGGGTGRGFPIPGADLTYTLTVDFLDAVNGGKKTVTMPDGQQLSITIPAGLKDGQTLRLLGKGQAGLNGGEPGDALVTINVSDHPVFERDGDTIRSGLDITLNEALSGAKVRAATVSGAVNVTVPKNANTGHTLRLRGKGVMNRSTGKRGDHMIELRIKLPAEPDEELRQLIADWEAKHPYHPREAKETA